MGDFKYSISCTVGFIGAGNMAKCIAFSAISKGILNPKKIIVSATSNRNLGEWEAKGITTTLHNHKVVCESKIIFLAVKPQYASDVYRDLQGCHFADKCLVSIMAGIPIVKIQEQINQALLATIRVMPNTPLLVGKGCSVMAIEQKNQSKEGDICVEMVKTIMSAGGSCDVINESLMDAAGAICGSGPAFMYLVMEALSDGGVKCGLPRHLSTKLAALTMEGAAVMVSQTGNHPGYLKDQVTSPGGTTIAGIHALENSATRCSFINAVEAAFNRSKELQK